MPDREKREIAAARGGTANDNTGAEARIETAVMTLARIIGRRIAREESGGRRPPMTTNRRGTLVRDRRAETMTFRCALYARYSSDQQRAASIEDQFRVCRERAERAGWKIAGAYKDSAVSGSSVILRPGVQALLEDAGRGEFDVVLAEALDRVSRDQADVAVLYKHLRFAGVGTSLASPRARSTSSMWVSRGR